MARQFVEEPFEADFAVVDVAEISDRAILATKLAIEEAHRPFSLADGPIARVRLLRFDERDHVLVVTIHHIACDGWSIGNLLGELRVLYEAYRRGEPSPLPELPAQFSDYASWQRETVSGKARVEQLAYWRKQLASAPGLLAMPSQRPRPAKQTFRGGMEDVWVPAPLTQSLKKWSQRSGASLFMVLHAAFASVLGRYSGQGDLVIGCPVANRTRREFEPLIGPCLNTLLLRTSVADDPTFRDLVGRVRSAMFDAYSHQDLPFEVLVAELQPERNLAHNPLFQVMFGFNGEAQALALADVDVAPIPLENRTAKFDLALLMEEVGGRIYGRLEYNADLFDRWFMRQMALHFNRVLEAVVRNADVRISTIRIASAEEQRPILENWNQTQVVLEEDDAASREPVHLQFEAQVARTPDALALCFQGDSLTYAELDGRAAHVAAYLRQLGIGRGARVAICLNRSIEMLVGILGVLKSGAAYVALDPTHPVERLTFMLEDARAPVLLTSEDVADRLPADVGHVVCLDADWDTIAAMPADPADESARVDGGDLAYVIYTSGSTGQPKGVLLGHAGLSNLASWHRRRYAITGSDRATQLAGPGFDASVWEIWPYLISGASLHIVPEDVRAAPKPLLAWLAEARISVAFLPTPLAEAVLVQPWPSDYTMRWLLTGGDRLHRGAPEGAQCTLVNHYGPTEGTVVATAGLVGAASGEPLGGTSVAASGEPLRGKSVAASGEPLRGKSVAASGEPPAIGGPIDNMRAYVLDRHLEPVPVGVPGELYIAGTGLAWGYLHRPDLTAERFVPDPFARRPGERLYRTGDVVRYLPNGEIDYLGRGDQQVKIRGYRIELGEIEAALRAYPQVLEGAVLVREERGTPHLAAYVVGTDDTAGLRRHLAAALPEYMVPAAIVALPSLPHLPSGKVDRKALEAIVPPEGAAFVAPSNPTQQWLASVWEDVLERSPIGIHDDFFELGGHSLQVNQIIARLSDGLRVQLSVRDVFEAPTVFGLSERIAQRDGEAISSPISPAPRGGALPVTFGQRRLWFLEQMGLGEGTYNSPIAFRVRGHLNERALEGAVAELVRRHEALRTVFTVENDEPVQVVTPAALGGNVAWHIIDLEGDPSRLAAMVHAEAWKPFDLAEGPLLRCTRFRLGDAEYVLLFTLHHTIFDGWSTGVFVRELGELYDAFAEERAPSLSDARMHLGDFAHWQRTQLGGERLTTQLNYWRSALEGAPAVMNLPFDRPRPSVQRYRGRTVPFVLDARVTEGLRALSQRAQASLFMTLLAAFATFLKRYSGEDDWVIGTPVAHRNHTEWEPVIGLLLNMLPLRIDMRGAPTFRELVARVRAVSLDAHAHQDVPFERLVEELAPARSLGHSPLFQTMFMFLDEEPPLRFSGLDVAREPLEDPAAKFDLSVLFELRNGGLSGAIGYNVDLFDEETIVRMVGHLQVLLAAVAENDEQPITRAPLLAPAEREQTLVHWNATRVDHGDAHFVHRAIELRAERTPDAEAVVFEGRSLSYREINRRANQLARRLRAGGVGPDVPVAVCMDRSAELVIALLAVMKAGGAYLPIDPSYPAERCAFVLRDAKIRTVLCDPNLEDRFRDHAEHVLPLGAGAMPWDDEDASNPSVSLSPANLAYVIYTSGSTGKPKGAMNTHAGLSNRLLWMQDTYRLDESDRALQKTPFTFDVSVWEFFWPLMTGAALVVARPEGHKDSAYLARLVEEQRITTLHFVPSMLRHFLDEATPPPCVRRVICSGEALPSDLVRAFFQRSSAELHNLYGPTEAAIDVTFWPCARDSNATTVPIGRPIANTRIHVLDAENAPVPVGHLGELYIGGISLARGYLGQPDLTAERFVPDPFATELGARLYRTGDLARYRSDGTIEFAGRIDHQVKLRGFRIELGEIEATLSTHAAVTDCAVVLHGEAKLVAYVCASEKVTIEALRSHLAATLPEYMVPAIFVFLERMPLSKNGKLDRRALPQPDGQRPDLGQRFAPPENDAEEKIAALWSRLLSIRNVGVHDNFFDLGGHSLLLVQMRRALREMFDVSLGVVDLFRFPTVRALAEHVTRAHVAEPLRVRVPEKTPPPRAKSHEVLDRMRARRRGAVPSES